MSKIIIHSAYPRTASTWFQDSFYPKINNYDFINFSNFREFIQNKNVDFNFKNINTNNNLVFCDEEIMNIKIDTLNIEEKAKKIKETFPNAIIIIFIRNQLRILESKYSFYIQNGGYMSFNQMIKHLFNTNKIRQWNYFEQINTYIKLFGEKNVKVFLYEDFKTNNKQFIIDFVSKFDFDINLNSINLIKKNYSLNKNIIKPIRFFNQISKGKLFFIQKTFFYLNKVLPQKNIKLEQNITPDDYLRITNYFSKSNKKIILELGLKEIQKYKYPL